ncbi:MAG: tetratricopeptide repeat protein [bacterium]
MNQIEDQKTDQFKPYPSDEGNKESMLQKWLEEGAEKLDQKDYSEAIKLFEKVLRIAPENLVAFEKLSIARSIQSDVNRIEDYLAMGRELMKQFDWTGAYDEFQAVLSIDPNNEEAKSTLKKIKKHLQIPFSEDDQDLITHGGEDVESDEDGHVEASAFDTVSEQKTDLYSHPLQTYQMVDQEFQSKLEEALRVYENGFLSRAKELLENLQKLNPEHSQVKFYLTAIDRKIEMESFRKNQINVEELFKKGMDSLERQDFKEARDLFKKVLEKRPDFQQARLMLDKIDVLKGSADTTREKTAVESSEDSKKTDRSLSATDGKIEKKSLSKPVKKNKFPSVAKVLIFIVLALVIIVAGAGTIYLVYIFPNARYEKSMALAQELDSKGKSEEAITWVKKALNAKPDSIDGIKLLGEVYLKTGKLNEAIDILESALDKYPENKTVTRLLAQTHFARKDWTRAEKYYKIIEDDPRFHDEAELNIAISRKNRGLIDDAIEILEKFVMENDHTAKGYFYLARCYQDKNEEELDEKIKEAYLKAIENDSELIEAYESLADYHYSRKELGKGIETLEKLLEWFKPATIEKSKRVASIRFDLGEMLYEAGRFKDAIDNFSTVIQIEPSVEAYRSLGRSHYKMDRLAEAILMWRKGLDLNKSDDDLWWQIGVAQFRLGDLVSAENSYKEALRYNPKHVRALTNLGFLYYQQYNYNLARKYWKQSLELDPDQPQLKQKLKEIDR